LTKDKSLKITSDFQKRDSKTSQTSNGSQESSKEPTKAKKKHRKSKSRSRAHSQSKKKYCKLGLITNIEKKKFTKKKHRNKRIANLNEKKKFDLLIADNFKPDPSFMNLDNY